MHRDNAEQDRERRGTAKQGRTGSEYTTFDTAKQGQTGQEGIAGYEKAWKGGESRVWSDRKVRIWQGTKGRGVGAG